PNKSKAQRSKCKDRFAFNKKAATRAASGCSFCCGSFHDDDSLVFIKVGEHHLNNLALLRRHMLTDVVRLNRQLAMFIAAIDQYGKLHAARPSEIDQLIQRSAHSATGVQNIVD